MSSPAFRQITVEEADQLSSAAIERLNKLRVAVSSHEEPAGRENESKVSPTEQEQGGISLTTDEQSYLRSIHREPFLNVGQRSALLGFTKDTSNAVKKELRKKSLIEEFALTLGPKVGGTAKYIVLTEEGYRTIEQVPPFPFRGKKGPVHRFLQHFAHSFLVASGFAAEIEMNRSGKFVDVGYKHHGKLLALELATTPDNEVTNVKRDLEAGFDKVVVLCTTRKVFTPVKRDFKKFLSDKERRRVEIVLLANSEYANALAN